MSCCNVTKFPLNYGILNVFVNKLEHYRLATINLLSTIYNATILFKT